MALHCGLLWAAIILQLSNRRKILTGRMKSWLLIIPNLFLFYDFLSYVMTTFLQ